MTFIHPTQQCELPNHSILQSCSTLTWRFPPLGLRNRMVFWFSTPFCCSEIFPVKIGAVQCVAQTFAEWQQHWDFAVQKIPRSPLCDVWDHGKTEQFTFCLPNTQSPFKNFTASLGGYILAPFNYLQIFFRESKLEVWKTRDKQDSHLSKRKPLKGGKWVLGSNSPQMDKEVHF